MSCCILVRRLILAENCHPGSNVTGYEVANAVRNIAHKYGILKQFKAYLEVADQVSSKTSILRSELQTSGVSLTDCPRKDVADKMLLGVFVRL
jgi:hypothetical protein